MIIAAILALQLSPVRGISDLEWLDILARQDRAAAAQEKIRDRDRAERRRRECAAAIAELKTLIASYPDNPLLAVSPEQDRRAVKAARKFISACKPL